MDLCWLGGGRLWIFVCLAMSLQALCVDVAHAGLIIGVELEVALAVVVGCASLLACDVAAGIVR